MSSDENITIPANFTLAFEDNFDDIGGQPNQDNWTFDTGQTGWGNGEAQNYTSSTDNSHIVDVIAADASELDTDGTADGVNGALKIIANKTGNEITSARIKSDIDDLGAYGYYEVRAKLPSESGAWPAIWLLGDITADRPWPDTGEIDLVEWSSRYFDEVSGNRIISALHFRGAADQPQAHGDTQFKWEGDISSPVDEWHTYQVWWSPDQIKIGVDGNVDNAHLTYSKRPNATNDDWPFDHPMDIILNIAIGGELGGTVPAGDFTYEMLVDYVRVYQGDWTTTDDEAYVAAAEGVISLASEVYPDETGTNWFPWGAAQYQGLVGGAHRYDNLDYLGIVPNEPIDLSGQDTVHLTVYRTDASADLIFKLVNVDGDGAVTGEGRLDIPAADVPANQWVELVFNKSDFINLNPAEEIGQIVLASTINGSASNETLYIKELYMSDSTITGPASDAVEGTEDYKGVFALQGENAAVTTNFMENQQGPGGDVITEVVSLNGDDYVQKYENLGYVAIRPEAPITIGELTTLHLNVWRSGTVLEDTPDNELSVLLEYSDSTTDRFVFGTLHGNGTTLEQWNHLEVPLSEMPNSSNTMNSGEPVQIVAMQIISQTNSPDGSFTGETLYLDGLELSAKHATDIVTEGPGQPHDHPSDVLSVYSSDYDPASFDYDPLTAWSTLTGASRARSTSMST